MGSDCLCEGLPRLREVLFSDPEEALSAAAQVALAQDGAHIRRVGKSEVVVGLGDRAVFRACWVDAKEEGKAN